MDNSDTPHTGKHKKPGLGSKIMWGGLIAGAAIAVAAVVGFVFAPDLTAQAVTAAKEGLTAFYASIGDAGRWLTENVMGGYQETGIMGAIQHGITNVYDGIAGATGWIGDNIIGTYKTEAFTQQMAEVNNITAPATSGFSIPTPFASDDFTLRGALDASDSTPRIQIPIIPAMTEEVATEAARTTARTAIESSAAAGEYATGAIKFIMGHKIVSLAAAGVGAYAIAKNSGKTDYSAYQHNPEADESFAMKEDMRKMQAVMVVKAAALGNPQAQAMLAQQYGRA